MFQCVDVTGFQGQITTEPVPLSLLEALPRHKREGCVATMSIHDPATGKLKRHLIRKVWADKGLL